MQDRARDLAVNSRLRSEPCYGEDVPQSTDPSGAGPTTPASSLSPRARAEGHWVDGLLPTGAGCLGGSALPSSRTVRGRQGPCSIKDDEEDQPDFLQDPRCAKA